MMRTFRMIIAIGLLASVSLGFVSCENKAAKEAEAAKIEQEKQEAINQALEEQNAELLREQQEQQELREQELKQQEEKERLERDNKANSIEQFVGTYIFASKTKFLGKFYYSIVEVLPDGRITERTKVDDELFDRHFVGNIKKISDHAFMIANSNNYYILSDSYTTHKGYSSKYNRARDVVFDINENKTYRELDDYNNRDISDPDYYEFTRN